MRAGRRSDRRGLGAGRWLGVAAVAVLLLLIGYELGRRRAPFGESEAVVPAATAAESSLSDTVSSPRPRDRLRTAEPADTMAQRPRVVLVIDDLGRSLRDIERLDALDVALTYSVLPFETRTAEVVTRLREMGAEFLCHIPMQAQGGANPGPGALTLAMSKGELRRKTRAALAAVPGAVGANNHMGSMFSTDRSGMRAVLEVLADEGLFFLDSRTSAGTVGYHVALEIDLAAAERQVFLDRDRAPEAIAKQFQELLDTAAARGQAIAIGHPYPETIAMLETEVPLARLGFDFVRLSRVVERPTG